jgi:hypothetical protein
MRPLQGKSSRIRGAVANWLAQPNGRFRPKSGGTDRPLSTILFCAQLGTARGLLGRVASEGLLHAAIGKMRGMLGRRLERLRPSTRLRSAAL